MAKATRFGAMSLSITAAAIAPLLAMDQKVLLPVDLFKGLSLKNYKEGRDKLLAGVRLAMDGKLRTGIALDASMEDLAAAVDAFKGVAEAADEPVGEETEKQVEGMATVEPPKPLTAPGATYDAEPMKAYMKSCGMDDSMIGKCMDMMPKNDMAGDSEETPEEKAAREKKEADEKTAKDAEMKDVVSKPAMDAALKAQSENFDKRVKEIRDNERGVRVALAEVQPYVGEIAATMAFDSASDVYRHALTMKNHDGAKTLHADALLPILKTYSKIGAVPPKNDGGDAMAMDSNSITKAIKMAPGLENISTQL